MKQIEHTEVFTYSFNLGDEGTRTVTIQFVGGVFDCIKFDFKSPYSLKELEVLSRVYRKIKQLEREM